MADLLVLTLIVVLLAGTALALQWLIRPSDLAPVSEPQKTPVLGGH